MRESGRPRVGICDIDNDDNDDETYDDSLVSLYGIMASRALTQSLCTLSLAASASSSLTISTAAYRAASAAARPFSTALLSARYGAQVAGRRVPTTMASDSIAAAAAAAMGTARGVAAPAGQTRGMKVLSAIRKRCEHCKVRLSTPFPWRCIPVHAIWEGRGKRRSF